MKKNNLVVRFPIMMGIFFVSAVLILFSCSNRPPSEKRAARAAIATGDIIVGIAYTTAYSNFFLEGVNMAVEEINKRGGIAGRKIRIIADDDHDDVEAGKKIARKLARNKDVIAVIGHGNPEVAVSALAIYEKEGIVFMSYGASNPSLTQYGNKYTLRNIPDDKALALEIARRMSAEKLTHQEKSTKEDNTEKAEISQDKASQDKTSQDKTSQDETGQDKTGKIKTTAVFYERSSAHRTFAEVLKKEVDSLGIRVVASRSYFKGDDEFKEMISGLKKESEFDSVFITGSLPESAIIVRQLREMGVDVPVFGGKDLDSPDLWAIAGKAAENIVVSTVFNARYPDRDIRQFVKRFESRNGFAPDTWAAQGYDAVSVVAHALIKGGSSSPLVLSTTLRFLENWKGVTGTYSFIPTGDIKGKKIFFKKLKDGEFVFSDQDDKYHSDLFNYIEDDSLRLPLKDPVKTLDPGITSGSSDMEIIEQLFLGLTGLDSKTYMPVPELATEWRNNRDNTTFVFFMRRSVWTDKLPVTAHDVVWAIRRNINPNTESPDVRMLYILKNAEAIHKGEIKDISKLGVRAADDYTVVFDLEYSAAYFPVLTNMGVFRPLPARVCETYKSKWAEHENIVTNGPYKLDIWEKGIGILLKKNPAYYDAENVSIPEIRYYVIPQPSLGLAMYENDELDVMGSSFLRLPFEEVPRIKKDPLTKNEYFENPHFCTYTYAFNTTMPPVDNPLVRKAISAAIDRQMLIDTELEGNGEPATTCTRPPVFGFPGKDAGISFDPLQARQWLAQAGYPDGEKFPEITIFYRHSKFHAKIASAVKANLEHYLNIKVNLKGEKDEKLYYEIVTTKDPPHIFRAKNCADYPDADSFLSKFAPSSPAYRMNWKNSEFEDFVKKAKESSDIELIKELYRSAEATICKKEAAVIPLYYTVYHCMVKPRIKGWFHMPTGGQHVSTWRIEK